MCPVTKWPPNSPSARSGRSKLTRTPTRANWRLVRSHVSRSRSKRTNRVLPAALSFTAVRQQPFTARLSPTFNPRAAAPARTVNSMARAAGLMAVMTPAS